MTLKRCNMYIECYIFSIRDCRLDTMYLIYPRRVSSCS
jgi:hypothetical protein